MRRDITLIVMFAVTVFLFLCNFMSLGIVGTFFSDVMFGLTGSVAYGLPILIFALYLYYFLASEKDPYVISRILGVIGLFLIVMILAELVSVDLSAQEGFDHVGIYTRSVQNRSGGGVIGGAIAFALYGLLRTVGTVLVLIVLAVACVYVIGQRSYLEMFRDRAMDARLAREERIAAEERYREEHPEEFEEDEEEQDEEEYAEASSREASHYEETRDRYNELREERKLRRREKEEERRRQEERERRREEERRTDRILNHPASASGTARSGSDASWNVNLFQDGPDAAAGMQGGIDLPDGFDRENEWSAVRENAGEFRNPPGEGGDGEEPFYSGYADRTPSFSGYAGEVPSFSDHSENAQEEAGGPVPENDDMHEIRPEDYDAVPGWNEEPLPDHPSGGSSMNAGRADYVTAVPLTDPEESGPEPFHARSYFYDHSRASSDDDSCVPSDDAPADLPQEERQDASAGILPDLPEEEPEADGAMAPRDLPDRERQDDFAEIYADFQEDKGLGLSAEDLPASSDDDKLPRPEESAEGAAQEPETDPCGTDFVPVHTARDGGESEITRALAQHQAGDEPAGAAGSAFTDSAAHAGKGTDAPVSAYRFPPIDLLRAGDGPSADSDEELRRTAHTLQTTLQNFGVNVTMTDISQGPSVTRYELLPEMGVKVSKIVSLADDIKLALAATDIRIEAPIPGKSAIGIEVPNREAQPVMLRDIIDTPEFRAQKSKLSFAVGKDIAGKPVYSDIAKMPHVLIAGATGSGKSVCINTIIVSILYHARPDEVKFIMIDPKVVELSVYNGIPHLLIPVVTDPQKATAALNWAVSEMEARYRAFADAKVREIRAYNALVKENRERGGDEEHLKFMPQIVVIVDELADLMMVAKSDVETAICRLAQLARAAGIHLIIATQRPSVDVITGLIKANMPSRIAFRVSSGVDSRTILDMNGAEKLLGKGDMLFFPQGLPKPNRVQGGFVSDDEVNEVVQFLQSHYAADGDEDAQQRKMMEEMETGAGSAALPAGGGAAPAPEPEVDELFGAAGSFIIEKNNASIGLLQRRYRIGFNRAARIMDQLCDAGVVGESEGTKSRTILMTPADFAAYCKENGIPVQDVL